MRTLLHPRRRLSWRLIRGTTWSLIRPGFASWTTLAALTGVCSERATPNGSTRGSEDREGASDSVPVLRQGRGGLWLRCGCSQPPVLTVIGYQSVMEAFGRISFYVLLAALFAHGNLDIAFTLVFQSSVFGCCPWSTLYSGRVLCLVQQWIHVYERLLANFTYFLRVVHSVRGFLLHSAEWRSVHS